VSLHNADHIIIEQHIGMPFIIIMQQQPGILMQFIMQSQQDWIIISQFLSLLVQVMTQPMSVISILHMPIMPMLQVQHIMPFIMQHMDGMPPCIIMQRFFIISAAVLSSQVIEHFMPPGHFSIIMVQRGIMPIIEPMPMPLMPGIIPPPIMPGIMFIEGIMFMPIMFGIIMPIPGIIMFGIIIWGIIMPPVIEAPIPIPRSVIIVLMVKSFSGNRRANEGGPRWGRPFLFH
jgi:hypothetical protein